MIAKVEPLTTARSLRGPFDYRLPPELAEAGVGSIVLVPFGRRRLPGVVVARAATSELPPERLAEPIRLLGTPVTPELVALGLWVAREFCSTPARGLELVLPPDAKREPPRRASRPRRPRLVAVGASGGRPRLTGAQRRAVARIAAAMDERGGMELLLHGVTGSGKTEVYLAAAARALERGRGVIVLVPEIGLTPQTVSRFAARFGDAVALLHSRLTPAQRRDEWRRLRAGEARVCVGPRSAIFAPVADLGLVIVDEEHDPAYKHEGDPRYDARDVAAHRAAAAGAVLLAGSATPRPESWHARERLELPERVDGARLPEVEVLDMRGRGGGSGPLHPRVLDALAELAERGGKAIVLAARRGWAPFVSCRACGRAWTCPSCDVSLVLHRAEECLRCHHCGHAEPAPGECDACGSVAVARHGSGSQRLAELIAEAAAPLPVFRLDSDSAARSGAHARILAEFERSPSGVLVGTQMVAKGHDFPDVTLSVVADADASLRFPDFRAEERTFAQVAQLAGRSGRGRQPGRVLVQTLAPQAAAIRYAARHDAAGFLGEELERRRALGYPPFASLVQVELSGAAEERVRAAADRLGELAAPLLPAGARLLGPAPRFRVRGRHRRRLLVKSPSRAAAVAAVAEAVERIGAERGLRGVALSVDVEPQ